MLPNDRLNTNISNDFYNGGRCCDDNDHDDGYDECNDGELSENL